MSRKQITLDDVMCRIQQAQTVLTLWLGTLTTDDENTPNMVDSVLTILDGLSDAIAIEIDTPANISLNNLMNTTPSKNIKPRSMGKK
ncbi:hypothetical protein ACNSPD_17695 [Yersinia enterocolitica]|uniref:hypothetical protein n=1 Tax=Yersinia TaxID=629 RepID=UPI003AB445A8